MTKRKKEPVHSKQIEALSQISKAVISELYLEDILKLIVTVTAEVMRSKICSLLLLDGKKGELSVKATQSVSEAYINKPSIKLGQGVAGRVANDGKFRTSLDVRKDPLYINRAIARKEKLCSLLSVPLKVADRTIGVLNCYTSRPHRFSSSEVSVLMTVANQAAIAIRNAELMLNARLIREELESRKIIERAKDIVMKEADLGGEEAYKRMRKQSMDSRKSMRDIAEAILLAHDIKR